MQKLNVLIDTSGMLRLFVIILATESANCGKYIAPHFQIFKNVSLLILLRVKICKLEFWVT